MDNFVYTFDTDELLNSSELELNVLGLYLKYIEEGKEEYKITANQTRSYLYSQLKPDDSAVLNVLSEYTPGNEEEAIRKLDIVVSNYPDSVIANAIRIYFDFIKWEKTKDAQSFKKILSSIDIIKESIGDTPFTVYYESILEWEASDSEKKDALLENLENMYWDYPSNRKIQELLIVQAFELEKFEKVTQLANSYISISNKDERIIFLIASSYFHLDKIKEARSQIEWIIQNSTKKTVLSKSYELLGDISNTLTQKNNYYKMSAEIDPENSDALAKLATSLYQENEKDNLEISRMYLARALVNNPDNHSIQEALKVIDRKLKRNYFLSIHLPFFIVLLGIFFVVYKFGGENKSENGNRNQDD
ncbi:lipopolysaccharide assembly protein LapB [Petrotoga sp. 9PW.55.5.1]|uniref:tetratricopeptide repeat protein n=1 Tax=Petrotoga sp. 9PW.55.5.1 TaxID=1308979 RepID=UPI0011BD0E8E|nr:hypothetical protein [Petrotoga sp. 9PW.55.5.1]